MVLFPGGDNRNGFWIGSVYAQAMDALTTDTDQFLEYDSHWSGHYHLLDGGGNYTESFADGSFIQVGSGTTVPATSRHTVDGKQFRQVTPITQAERVPNPPKPFNITMRHISGTEAAIDPIGNTVVSGAAGASLTMKFGGTQASIDKTGNTVVSGAAGAALTVVFGGATLNIDPSGNVTLTAATIKFGGVGEPTLPLLNSLAAAVYNSHTHPGGGAAVPQMTAPDATIVFTAG